MDVLPIKFRSPPPKPPRRRHSDQLCVPHSGTFHTKGKKFFEESQCRNNLKEIENSTCCGSLPSDWTPDYSLEEKIEKLHVFNEQDYSIRRSKNVSQNFSCVQDIAFDKIKGSMGLFECKNISNHVDSRCASPYIHQILKEDVLNSSFTSSNSLEHFKKDLSNLNIKRFPNVKKCGLFAAKSISKEYHRRHNSDPLPSNFSYNDLTLSPTLNNRLFNSCLSEENQCLFLELRSLKEINSKLWEHLCSLQASLDSLKKCAFGNSKHLSISDILSSLYDSLKAKENAMEDRIQIITQERDNAIQDLDSMVQIVAGSFEDYYCNEGKSSDKEIKKLLKDIEATCSPIQLLRQQRLLLSYLYRLKELKQDHMLHELKLAASERDNLRAKVKLLEAELNKLKLSNEIWSNDNKYWESSLFSTLYQAVQQRDVAINNFSAHNLEYSNSR